jgi:hypothetical protein
MKQVNVMRAIIVTAVLVTMQVACSCPSLGQEDKGADTTCEGFKNAVSPDLAQYLNGVVPDAKNADCVTLAIHKLGKERYAPAISALVKLLDFRRPLTQQEKMGFWLRPRITEELFPAAEALELIGKEAIPELLSAIKAGSTSGTARENAVAVWMEIYRHSDEHPRGVADLKREETKVNDNAVKQRLVSAVQKALTKCNPEEKDECQRAAATGAP